MEWNTKFDPIWKTLGWVNLPMMVKVFFFFCIFPHGRGIRKSPQYGNLGVVLPTTFRVWIFMIVCHKLGSLLGLSRKILRVF